MLLLGVLVMLFERPAIHALSLWPDVIREVMSFAGGLLCLGVLLAGWSQVKRLSVELWQEMSLAQKSLAWLCCALALRGAFSLVLWPFPDSMLIYWITLALQISGGAALALIIVPVMSKVFATHFTGFRSLSTREKSVKLFDAGFFPFGLSL